MTSALFLYRCTPHPNWVVAAYLLQENTSSYGTSFLLIIDLAKSNSGIVSPSMATLIGCIVGWHVAIGCMVTRRERCRSNHQYLGARVRCCGDGIFIVHHIRILLINNTSAQAYTLPLHSSSLGLYFTAPSHILCR